MALVLSLLKRFRRDERGAFIVMFGIMAVVLTAMAGAVVDFTHLSEARNRAQIAMDAAALALQPRIFDSTSDTIRAAAENLMRERMGNSASRSWISNVEIDVEEGTLQLRGGIDVEMAFVRLIGFNNIEASVMSEATRRKLALEVTMVLDNSGSMLEQNRMTHLKNAAACAARTLFYDEVDQNCQPVTGARQVEDVKIGIVPFTMYVNVGADQAGQYWLDWDGLAPVSQDNFEVIDGKVDRRALFANLRRSNNQSNTWTGCVMAREYPLDTDDTTPDAGVPPTHARTLFTPLFVPDVRDGVSGSYITDRPSSCAPMECEQRHVQSCNWNGNNCNTGTYSWRTRTTGNWSGWSSTSCVVAGAPTFSNSSSGTTTKTTTTISSLLNARQLQERQCKYNVSGFNASTTSGPNAYCPTISILPLSDNPTTVIGRINAMVADGGTNIHEGTAWGMRTLSPTEPFTQASPYDEATSKVLIVMTDGENTAYPATNMNGATYHGAYGFPVNNRLGANGWNTAQLNAEMDKRTLETCRTAKNLGMMVYTIGLSVTHQATRTMLTSCASGSDYVFFPTQPTELNDVFQSIAQQLAALRLSQ